MANPSLQEIISDPEFKQLPELEKIKVFKTVDPEFAKMSSRDQNSVMLKLTGGGNVPDKNIPNVDDTQRLQPSHDPTRLMEPAHTEGIKPVTADEALQDMVSKGYVIPLGGGGLTDISKSALEGVKTSPKALYKIGAETVKAISPIPTQEGVVPIVETAKGVTKMLKGVAQQLIPGEQPEEEIINKLAQEVYDTYGSFEGINKKISTDLPGFMMDVSSIFTGAGATLKTIPTTTKISNISNQLSKIGAITEPISGISFAVKKVGDKLAKLPILSEKPVEWYRQAVKFTTSAKLTNKDINKLALTAVREGIMPTQKGLDKLYDSMGKIEVQIGDMVDQAQRTGEKLDINKLFVEFDKLKESELLSGIPKQKREAIEKVKKDFLSEYESVGKKDLTPIEAQQMKRKIYQDVKKSFSKNTKETLKVTAQKEMARQTMLFLEKIIPDIKGKNKAYGEKLALASELPAAVKRISNHDILSLRTLGSGTTGGVVAGPLGAGIGAFIGVLDHPKIKSKLAIMLKKLQTQNVKLNTKGAALRDVLYQSGKLKNEIDDINEMAE